MSFQPITRWVLRCDGVLAHHRPCPTVLNYRYDVTTGDAAHARPHSREPGGSTDNRRCADHRGQQIDSAGTPTDLSGHTSSQSPGHSPPGSEHDPDLDPDLASPHAAAPVAVWATAVFDRPILSRDDDGSLRAAGWLRLRDGRVLCPRHVAALEYLASAEIDGLPFQHGKRA